MRIRVCISSYKSLRKIRENWGKSLKVARQVEKESKIRAGQLITANPLIGRAMQPSKSNTSVRLTARQNAAT
jgi:hypothetical protein